jgi:hypothetical protein
MHVGCYARVIVCFVPQNAAYVLNLGAITAKTIVKPPHLVQYLVIVAAREPVVVEGADVRELFVRHGVCNFPFFWMTRGARAFTFPLKLVSGVCWGGGA